MKLLRTIWTRRELLWNLTSRELKQRYKGSALGFLWSVLTPLFMAAIYVVFLRLLARGVPMQDILIGVFAWQFTTQCVMGGMSSVTGNANLVKKVAFPREILPLSQVCANGIGYLLSLLVQFPVLALLLWRDGSGFSSAWPLFLFWMVWQAMFNLGVGSWVGALNVYFRDTQHLVGVLLSAWFFMSPVMYNMDFAKNIAFQWPWVVNLLYMNPMAVILNGYRAALLPGVVLEMPPAAWVGFALTPIMLFAGIWTYRRLEKNFADLL
ncbi:MAG: ABC transporter permease [Verrucomicrobiota bacterium]|nr:ABC transporter permease [Verrucomicrobiota bacterium]